MSARRATVPPRLPPSITPSTPVVAYPAVKGMPCSSNFSCTSFEVSCSSPLSFGCRWRWRRKALISCSYRPPLPFIVGFTLFPYYARRLPKDILTNASTPSRRPLQDHRRNNQKRPLTANGLKARLKARVRLREREETMAEVNRVGMLTGGGDAPASNG